jgi:hypothetical protein
MGALFQDRLAVGLRFVGGDENGSLESETVKCGRESHGTPIREWVCWRGPAVIVIDRPVLSSERAPHINEPATDSNKDLVLGSQMGALFQDRLAVGLRFVGGDERGTQCLGV